MYFLAKKTQNIVVYQYYFFTLKRRKCGFMKKFIVLCFLLVFVFTVCAVQPAALSKVGSRGSEVTAIQTRLAELGYFKDRIDGIFGSRTKAAVIAFQRDRGLTADGIAGKNTLAALGVSSSGGGWSDSQINLLAQLISAEARGEPYAGQVAVGAVVLNRIEHPSFPDSLSGVIYERGAFSCLDDGQFYEPIASSAYSAARDAINGMDPSGGAIYYYNPVTATNKWIRSRPVIATIGKHVFCS